MRGPVSRPPGGPPVRRRRRARSSGPARRRTCVPGPVVHAHRRSPSGRTRRPARWHGMAVGAERMAERDEQVIERSAAPWLTEFGKLNPVDRPASDTPQPSVNRGTSRSPRTRRWPRPASASPATSSPSAFPTTTEADQVGDRRRRRGTTNPIWLANRGGRESSIGPSPKRGCTSSKYVTQGRHQRRP